ncbi:MAG: hypothetical protein IJT25_00655 [Clostridia bacterium]|nr:hypothetical protein [Clostridia bacterium]
MNILFYIVLGLAIVSACLFICLSHGQRNLLSLSLKSIASFCFVSLALITCFYKGLSVFGMLVVLGLVASLIGDIVLGLPDMPEMKNKATILTLIGGLAFAIAHIFYISAMIYKFGFVWWIVLIAVALGLIFCYGNKMVGKLDYGNLNAGMPIYATFISLVVSVSIMGFITKANIYGSVMLFVGFILFWLSDIVLMNIYFGGHNDKINQKLYYFNLAFYYGAQILIASSLVFLI